MSLREQSVSQSIKTSAVRTSTFASQRMFICQQHIWLYFSFSILFIYISQSFWLSEGVIVVRSSNQNKIQVVFYLITSFTYKDVFWLPLRLRKLGFPYITWLIARNTLIHSSILQAFMKMWPLNLVNCIVTFWSVLHPFWGFSVLPI